MSVLDPTHRLMLATGNEWHKIVALLLMKLPGEEARITVVAQAAGETSWNGEWGRGSSGRQWAECMDSTGLWLSCEGMHVAFYRATPTEAA
ncbi:hypothetical protein C9I56_41725 [Paraburkholderia caribensis]|nr:hypothetical protein C9I56_41725 [Paraburkholderia caribensis]